MYYKNCLTCKETLPLEDFEKRPDGRSVYRCRKCSKAEYDNLIFTPHENRSHNAAMSMVSHDDPCVLCGCYDRKKFKLYAKQSSNGSLHCCWLCLSCGRPQKNIKKPHKDIDASLLPRRPPWRQSICAVTGCERLDTELHHWLPIHTVDDFNLADSYPQSYLCMKHHRLWHSLVTPNMYKKGKMK